MMEITDVQDAVRELGKGGNTFRSVDARAHLGVKPADRNEAARVFNSFKSLERDGVIEEVPTGRKRNKLYKLASSMVGEADRGEGQPSTVSLPVAAVRMAAPDRLTRMENRLDEIEGGLSRIEGMLQQLIGIWT